MKYFKRLLLLFVLMALLTTGCGMKEHFNVKVNSNKEVSIEMIMAMDNDMIDAMIKMGGANIGDEEAEDEDFDLDADFEEEESEEETEEETEEELNITDEMRWEYINSSLDVDSLKEQNIKYEKYEKDGYKGYTVYLATKNIDELSTTSSSEKVSVSEMEDAKEIKLFIKDGDVYKSNLNKASDEITNSATQYQQMGAVFDLKFVLTLPNKSISNNATTVSKDGLTLTWDLTKAEKIDFEFKFEPASNFLAKYLPYIIGGVALLIIIIIVAVILSQKKKAPATNTDNGPVQDVNNFENKSEGANYANNVNPTPDESYQNQVNEPANAPENPVDEVPSEPVNPDAEDTTNNQNNQ